MDKSIHSTPPMKPGKPKYPPKKTVMSGGGGGRKPPSNNGCAVTAVALMGGLAAGVGGFWYGVYELAKAIF